MNLIRVFALAGALAVLSCNNDKKQAENADSNEASTTNTGSSDESSKSEPKAGNVKEYQVTFETDTALLGKQKNLLITLKGGTAIALQDQDGKDQGIELTIRLTLTNKSSIGTGSSDHVDYTDSRLQLDNGTNISAKTGTDYVRAEPEATSKEESWTYTLPAGTKSKALTLFKDDTRVVVGVTMK